MIACHNAAAAAAAVTCDISHMIILLPCKVADLGRDGSLLIIKARNNFCTLIGWHYKRKNHKFR